MTTVSMPSAPAAGGAAGPRSSTGSAYIAGSGLGAVIFAANYTKGGGACGLSLTALMLTADMRNHIWHTVGWLLLNCESWVPYIATCNLPNTTRASAHYKQLVKACMAATCQLTATSSGSCGRGSPRQVSMLSPLCWQRPAGNSSRFGKMSQARWRYQSPSDFPAAGTW